jgi:hypothetical protein
MTQIQCCSQQDITQLPAATSVDSEGHALRRVGKITINLDHDIKNALGSNFPFNFSQYAMYILEKLKSRLNRRLQKLARWGDKPVDDRQPSELRMQLRNNIQMPLKSSYGGLINLPAPAPYNTPANSTITNTRGQPTVLNSTSSTSSQPGIAASTSLSVVSSAPSSSSLIAFDKMVKVSLNQQQADTMSSHGGLAVSTTAQQLALQNNAPNFSTASTISAGGSGLSMLGAMGGTSLSMGGMKMDLDAIRALQMQSVKELSEALKGDDLQSSSLQTTSISPSPTAPVDVAPEVVLLDDDSTLKSDKINDFDAVVMMENYSAGADISLPTF